jgi:hypothetical protein
MNNELKKAIINYILDNEKEFQIINTTVNNFRAYIYDDKGSHLIGGKEVHDWICTMIPLLTK